MADSSDALLTALKNKIAQILTGGDDTAPPSQDNGIAWCLPGIPFQPEDLQFAVKGISGKDGDETRQLVRTAAEFSRFVNFIPAPEATFKQDQRVLWNIYDDVLRFSQVVRGEMTPEQKAKIAKFRALMTTTVKQKDIVTDEEKEVVVDAPMWKAYKEKMAAYDDARLEYNAKRLAALNSEDRQSVQDFTLNADTYRRKVRQALADWTTNGRKEDVEKINAFIAQVSEKDLVLRKQELRDIFEKGKMTDPNSGADFWLSTFYPGNFVNSDKGWTRITFSRQSVSTYSQQAHSSTNASAGGAWFPFSFGGSGGHESSSSTDSLDSADFKMEFSLAQVGLARPWFSPEFLLSSTWRLSKNSPISPAYLSDGRDPPQGALTQYTTAAIFVKDITITSTKIKSLKEATESRTSGGASIGWGPFRLSGRHEQRSAQTKSQFDEAKNTVTVAGLQLIAFRTARLPACPNPTAKVDESAWDNTEI